MIDLKKSLQGSVWSVAKDVVTRQPKYQKTLFGLKNPIRQEQQNWGSPQDPESAWYKSRLYKSKLGYFGQDKNLKKMYESLLDNKISMSDFADVQAWHDYYKSLKRSTPMLDVKRDTEGSSLLKVQEPMIDERTGMPQRQLYKGKPELTAFTRLI